MSSARRDEILPEEEAYRSSSYRGRGGGTPRDNNAARYLPEEVVEQQLSYDSDEDDDYEEEEEEDRRQRRQQRRPQPSMTAAMQPQERDDDATGDAAGAEKGAAVSAEEAAMDLAELEALHNEAERMKGLGNRHMASQEYTRAYNAYSAALQLSPVGPSSHVYLSNRAAALLSLKRYAAAATDARRAVALAPSFGKAHARLGQALYFLKEYSSAVAAYEEAVRHEPDNTVTWTYLAKAQSKLAKEEEKRRRRERGEETTVTTSGVESMPGTIANSIATDPNKSAALVAGSGDLRASSVVMRAAVGDEFRRKGQGGGGRQQGSVPEASAVSSGDSDNAPPPLEVRTGVMGPGGAQAKPYAAPPPPIRTDLPLHQRAGGEEEPLSPMSEPSPRHLMEAYSQDPNIPDDGDDDDDDLDLDFDEALRLQEKADRYLSVKQYRSAVEEYSAALFLVPDDEGLSPLLHLGRAHALNGLKRHESATNDARMALSLVPRSAEAYSILAKSLFYAMDYEGSVEAFERSAECLGPGEEVSEFDRAYLEKAREALEEEERNGGGPENDSGSGMYNDGRRRRKGGGSVVPKLKPPRFVSREEILKSQPVSNRPMPKSWPDQGVRSPKSFHVGRERDVHFLSESMGIKLNRGPDGVVRVLSVSAGGPIVRKGIVEAGDVVREAHGVDLRRPITNVMWGDTVALIKLAPRPVKLVFAKELSPIPPAVAEEMDRANAGVGGVNNAVVGLSMVMPSPASGEEAVGESRAAKDAEREGSARSSTNPFDDEDDDEGGEGDNAAAGSSERSAKSTNPFDDGNGEGETAAEDVAKSGVVAAADGGDDSKEHPGAAAPQAKGSDLGEVQGGVDVDDAQPPPPPRAEDAPPVDHGEEDDSDDDDEAEGLGWVPSASFDESDDDGAAAGDAPGAASAPPRTEAPTPQTMRKSSKLDREVESLGGQILFVHSRLAANLAKELSGEAGGPPTGGKTTREWNNERWESTSSDRTLRHSGVVSKLLRTGMLFWSGETFETRTLALYRDPDLILVLRPPKSAEEVKRLLASSRKGKGATNQGGSEVNLLHSYLVAETVVDPATCKLRLSPLTTATSIPENKKGGGRGQQQSGSDDPRRRTCFELVTPHETLVFSAVVRSGDEDEIKQGAQDGEAGDDGEGGGGSSTSALYSDSKAYYETSAWEVALSKALFDVHRPVHEALSYSYSSFASSSSGGSGGGGGGSNFETDQAWMHQVVLGTLHSHALAGDVGVLKRALDVALQPKGGKELSREERSRVLDGKDEFGLTALHYACARRLSAVVNLLISVGADSTIPTLLRRKTPSHLSAEFLDEKSLSTILSASVPVRPDPNALDTAGRTPMYVASVEGKAVGGVGNSVALDRCLSALEAWGGTMLGGKGEDNLESESAHPIHLAAARWRTEELEVLFSHCRYLFPLMGGNAGGPDCTVGAYYHYPLHASILALRRKIAGVRRTKSGGAEFEGIGVEESPLVGTVRILLNHGVEPNERLEGVPFSGGSSSDVNDMFGLTPLQVLAAAALETKSLAEGDDAGSVSSMVIAGILECIADAAELLVKNGARISVDAPPVRRIKRESSLSQFLDDDEDDDERRANSSSLPSVDRKALKIDSNMDVLERFGGDERLRSAKAFFASGKSVRATTNIVVHENANKESLSSSGAPGGNDSNSCALCWDKFGKIRNRKHTCRVSRRYVCESCSTKRIVQGGKEFRLSDGQYRVAVVETERRGDEAQRKRESRENRKKNLLKQTEAHQQRYGTGGSSGGSGGGGAAARMKARAKAKDDADSAAKDELFGGASAASAAASAVKNFFFEEVEVPAEDQSPDDRLRGIASTMNQTRDAFNERGEKLNTLSEKTSALKDASRDFAAMAKQLNEKQKNSWW